MNRKQQPDIQELSKFNLLPVERIVLPNGIPVMIINSEEQSICRIDFMFGGGYWTQDEKLQAFITNSMLREGTRSYSSVQLAEKMDFYGSVLELSMFPQYVYITGYCLNKYFEQTAALLNSMIIEPTFPRERIWGDDESRITKVPDQLVAGEISYDAQSAECALWRCPSDGEENNRRGFQEADDR